MGDICDIPQNTPKLHILSCIVAGWSWVVVVTPLGVFGGVWGCLGAQMRVFEFKIIFLHPSRALEIGQIHPKIGQNRPKYHLS